MARRGAAAEAADFSPQFLTLEQAYNAPGGVMEVRVGGEKQAIAYRHKLNRARVRHRRDNGGVSKFDALSIGLNGDVLVITRTDPREVEYRFPVTGETGRISDVLQAVIPVEGGELMRDVESVEREIEKEEARQRAMRIRSADAEAEAARLAGEAPELE